MTEETKTVASSTSSQKVSEWKEGHVTCGLGACTEISSCSSPVLLNVFKLVEELRVGFCN